MNHVFGVDFLDSDADFEEDGEELRLGNRVGSEDVVVEGVVLDGEEDLDEMRGNDFASDLLDYVGVFEELVDFLAHDDFPQFEEVLLFEGSDDHEVVLLFVPYSVQEL